MMQRMEGLHCCQNEHYVDAGVCPACAAQAQKYAALRKPYLINDMAMQDVLLDRRRVYQKLQARRCTTYADEALQLQCVARI